MFKQYYQRLNIALPKFLTALLVGLLLPPISGVVDSGMLTSARALTAPTTGGAYFDVSKMSYLSVAASSNFQFSTSDDFTIAWWQNSKNNTSWPRTWSIGNGSNNLTVSQEGGTFYLWKNSSYTGTYFNQATTTDTWVHYVVVRSSGTLKIYENGIQRISVANSQAFGDNTNAIYIGTNLSYPSDQTRVNFSGYLTGFEIIKGTAKYSGSSTTSENFVVPSTYADYTTSVTSGTKLLLFPTSSSNLTTDLSGTGSSITNMTGASYNSVTYGSPALPSRTVTFDANSGTGSPSSASLSGNPITLATKNTLARSGYTFSGWNTAADGSGTNYAAGSSYSPSANTTLYAQWNSYIQYAGNGATSGQVPDSTTAKSSAAVTTLATNSGSLARSNFTFGGWNTNETGTGTSYTLPKTNYASTGDITLYARWDSTITYLGNGNTSGTAPSATSLSGLSGTLAAKGTLAKTVNSLTYTFGGWNTNETGTGTNYAASSSYISTGTRNLYAQWNSVITYNGNSNTGGSAPANTTISGVSGTLASNTGNLVNGSKVFAGWNTNSSGTGTRYAAGGTYSNIGNVTLYAQWVNVLTFTGSSAFSTAQGSAYRSDTYTAINGLETKTVSYTLSPANVGITLETSTSGSTTYAYIRVAGTVPAGTYTDTLTATDLLGTAVSQTVTISVITPLRWSASNATTLAATLGKSTSLQLDFVNGSTGKIFTMTQSTLMQNPGITLDTSTVSSGYVKLNISSRVGPGIYSVTVNGTDATGVRISTTISVTVNNPITMGVLSTAGSAGLSSLKFNGSNQFVRYNASTKWALGSTWTIEWWQYETSTSGTQTIMGQAPNFFRISLVGANLQMYTNSATPITLSSSLVLADRRNKWTHFAIVSNNGSITSYQNGIALNSTPISFSGITNSEAPSNYAFCIGVTCSSSTGTSGAAGTWFGGYLANIALDKRVKYSGNLTASTNFTPDVNLSIDSRTVIALTVLTGENTFTDLSNSAVTQDASYPTLTPPVGDKSFPNLTLSLPITYESTQGKPRSFYSVFGTGGSGVKTMSSTALTSGVVYSASNGLIAASIQESATAISSTESRITYETITATDVTGATTTIPVKVVINPPVVLTATSLNPTVAAGLELYDTVTATFGTGTKLFYASTQKTPSITRDYAANNQTRIKVGKATPEGTYYETVTAIDDVGDTETIVITITVAPGLSMTSATGSTSLTATQGKAASLQLNTANGSGTKTFTLTHLGTVSAGITIDTTTVVGAAILKISTTVLAGTYSERVTVTDSQGATVSLTISVTVNQAPSISYAGSVSGTITLTTTAGKALTSGAFTAALGTGTRTLSLSGLNSQVSIDTSTANIGYLILGSGLTATNSTTDKTYYETITVTDSLSATSKRAVTIVVKPAVSQTASFLTLNTTAGVSIIDTVTASYGTGNKTFSLAISPNVSGISFTNSVTNQAVITVANTLSPGTYTITVTATDSVSATSSIDITLNVASSLSISGSSNITSTAGYAFTSPVYSSTGGSGNTSFALVSPPTGVSLSASSGSPSILVAATGITSGTYNLTLRATDSVTAATTFAITLVVNPPVTLDGNKTLSKVYGEELTQVYQTNSGTAPYRIFASNICTTEKSTDGSYTVEKFGGTGTCNWNVPTSVSSLEVLTVAGGGGGGGSAWAGGGGAGGVVYVPTYSVTEKQSISVVVGAGGNGGTNDTACNSGSSPSQGSNGGNSSFNSTFTAVGGGGGGGYGWGGRTGCGSGKQGGSGGGSGETDYTPTIATSTQGSFANATSYGNSGGRTTYLGGVQAGSGGGGAGGVGGSTIGSTATARDRIAGAGGAGTSISITGSAVTYGGGGGGATCSSCGSTPQGTIGAGGSGGGGAGGNNASSPGNGTNGLGGGGGGSQTGTGGKGGSGVVIVRYLTPAADSSTTTLTMTTLTTNPTGSLQLNAPKNLPVGTYTQTITVTDANGSTGSTPVNVVLTVSKATPNLSLSIPGGGTTVTYGSPVTISASSTTAGNFDFKKGGTTISGCGTKATSSGVATCSWTPTDTSTAVISAAFSPSDSGNWNSVTSTNLTLTVSQADTLTVTFGAQDFNYTGSAVSVSRSYTLSGLTSIDSITEVTTLITGTANDSSSYSSNTGPTKAGAYSLTGTAVTFSGSTKASYYKSIVYVPANININRAANVISLRYGLNNIVTYKPTGVETATAGYLGTGAISFSTSSSTYCSVDSSSGDLTTILAGSCDVSLSVAQGSNYLGDTVTATVTINKAPRTIAISSSKSSLKYSETATVTTTINFDGSDGAISYSVGSTTGCSFDQANNLLTAISGTATCALAATIGEGANYLSATSSTLSFTLSKADAPTLTLIAPANIDYSPSATSSDIPLPTFTLTGLKLDDTATALSNMTITYLASGTYAYNSTTVPTGANVYTITPSSLTLSTGDISNYQSPIIVSASWTINQIAQAALLVTSLLQEGITVPYDVQYTGGSTNGTVTANIVAGGTATNCSFVGNSLRANSSGSCVIQLTMAGNQNYLAVSSETITVVIANFVQSIFNFDSLASGSTGITITSEVPYTVDVEQCSSECVPTIASISQTTFQGGDQLVITGTDFLGATAVVFNRTVFVTVGNGMQVDDNNQITVVVPMGLTAGAGSISVKNDLKISARLGGLTITG